MGQLHQFANSRPPLPPVQLRQVAEGFLHIVVDGASRIECPGGILKDCLNMFPHITPNRRLPAGNILPIPCDRPTVRFFNAYQKPGQSAFSTAAFPQNSDIFSRVPRERHIMQDFEWPLVFAHVNSGYLIYYKAFHDQSPPFRVSAARTNACVHVCCG